MKPSVNFTPGPSQLYFTVADHARKAFRDHIPSVSHRSSAFENIVKETKAALRELLGIPDTWHILFAASATEIWERIIQNLVFDHSLHLVNGAFSYKFYQTAVQLKKHPVSVTVAEGEGFESPISNAAELIAVTHNETSTGVELPVDFIHSLKTTHPDSLVVVDAVSSLPYPTFDFSRVDSVFFSVQKGFGLPAGLGVWLVNETCLAKAEQILSKKTSIGSYHSLPSLVTYALKNQTPETPNVLGIYLLSKVVTDMLRRGMQAIRNETLYKATLLYQALQQNEFARPFVRNPGFRSKTVIVANCAAHTQRLTEFLQTKGIQPGEGYGPAKTTQLRFANFPAHSKEQVELLVDLLTAFHP